MDAPIPELTVELLADHPELVPQVGRMRWQEWGYGTPDPTPWIETTAHEAGRDSLPVTVVAVGPAGDAIGAVGLDETDDELNRGERAGRSPWVIGTVVRRLDRSRDVGRRLLNAIETLAAGRGHRQIWVATGDEAVGFYHRCGWWDVEKVRLESTGIWTTILTKCLVDEPTPRIESDTEGPR